ncbi:DUF2065 domain-containing protein [Jiella sonneratiae]|uniref:DUF2065 domain-containing protein n=1 Tax=Jiella sonneratiae TaxID=2816856 RepID=A0ABS3J0A1_9HYPH|nr:DUF2065 domain-containing protein [Jiella sonneratiae]MBO0903087.1 DUF2065 domain-containing protein [Jiella sonneratiae]
MTDFFDALGLVLVIEGVVYCLFPGLAKRLARAAFETSAERLRYGGLVAACLGLGIVWIARR